MRPISALLPSCLALTLSLPVAALPLAALAGCSKVSMADVGLPEDLLGSSSSSSARSTRATRQPSTSTSSSTSAPAQANDLAISRAIIPGIAGEPDMRIRLKDAATSLKLGISIGQSLFVLASDAKPPAQIPTPITITLDQSGWTLKDAANATYTYPPNTELEFAPDRDMLAPQSPRPLSTLPATGTLARAATDAGLTPQITVDNARFPGKIRLTPRSEVSPRAFDVIEHVGIEQYLPGVVTAEMWSTWPITAFRVQAVAARSYALHQRALSRSQGLRFDVESTVKDQAYSGDKQNANAARAVRDTQGVVLTWNNQILRAYYSSTSGGRPASAKDTWPIIQGFEYNLAGPLQAQSPLTASPREELGKQSPFFRWQTTRTRPELLARLKQWGRVNGHPVKELPSLSNIALADSNPAGRPTRFTITSNNGQIVTISAEALRFACNQPIPNFPEITRTNRVNSGDMTLSIVGDTVNISGRGFGHGVGMCQWSVKELADRNLPYDDIILRFYPGAKLQRAY